MIIEISIAFIAVAFVVLVFFLVRMIIAARISLEQANRTLAAIQSEMHGLSLETTRLIQNTNVITADVQTKMKSLDSLFNSVGQVGDAVHQVTDSVKQVSAAVTNTTQQVHRNISANKVRIADILEWANAGFLIWKNVSGRIKENKNSNENTMNKGENANV